MSPIQPKAGMLLWKDVDIKDPEKLVSYLLKPSERNYINLAVFYEFYDQWLACQNTKQPFEFSSYNDFAHQIKTIVQASLNPNLEAPGSE